jgi:hypothetical protein
MWISLHVLKSLQSSAAYIFDGGKLQVQPTYSESTGNTGTTSGSRCNVIPRKKYRTPYLYKIAVNNKNTRTNLQMKTLKANYDH